MGKTFNRTPVMANLPTSSENKEYFFNHYNWKGMSDDKNFLTSDQETFESCTNVYVDDEGLLRSRPSLKRDDLSDLLNEKLINFWCIDEFIIFLSESESKYKLTFTKINDSDYKKVSQYDDPVILVAIADKIFIFTSKTLLYFDKNTGLIKNGESYIYIPETSVSSGSSEEQGEAKNLLIDSSTVVYLYVPGDNKVKEFFGKKVILLIGEDKYEVELSEDVLGKYLYTYKTDVYLDLSSFSFESAGLQAGSLNDGSIWIYNNDSGEFIYSPDGITFTRSSKLFYGDNELPTRGITSVSEDGTTAFISGKDFKTYRFSIIKEDIDGELKYRHPEPKLFLDYDEYTRRTIRFKTHSQGVVVHHTVFDSSSYEVKEDLTWNELLSNYKAKFIHCDFYSDDKVTSVVANVDSAAIVGFAYDFVFCGNVVDVASWGDSVLIMCTSGMLKCKYDIDPYNGLVEHEQFANSITEHKYLLRSLCTKNKLICLFRLSTGTDPSGLLCTTDLVYNELPDYDIGSWKQLHSFDNQDDCKIIVGNDNIIAWNTGIYDFTDKSRELPINVDGTFIPLFAVDDALYYTTTDFIDSDKFKLYSTGAQSITIKYVKKDSEQKIILNKLYKSRYLSFNGHVFSVDNSLYHTVTKYNDKNEFMWYIPDYSEEKLPENVTDLVTLSSNEFAALCEHQIWNVYVSDSGYSYNKSKLQTGLRNGAKTITAYDGNNILFITDRGLLSLGYKDFIATTDQSLTYMSDTIMKDFIDFCAGKVVNLVQHKHWIFCYNYTNKIYVLDTRNNSWWPMTLPANLNNVFSINDELKFVLNDSVYYFDTKDEDYKDFNSTKIPWSIKSQKLHLNAINYHKHVSNITLLSVLDSNLPVSFKLKVINYRNQKIDSDIEIKEFNVDTIRTHVQRLSFPKVNEFQYEISNDDEQYLNVPLSLSGISIKYRIGGQVR